MLKQLSETGYSAESEEILVNEIKAGNRKAWDALTQVFYTPLIRFINGMVHNADLAEELAQDIFVNLWLKRKNINVTTSLTGYLYRSARNHTLNFIKRRKFEQTYQQKAEQHAQIETNETEEQVHFSALEKQISGAIEALPESCREIFKLSRYEGLTYKEIGNVLGISPRKVQYQIGNALKILREELKGYTSHENF